MHSYDDIPYTNNIYPQTHPNTLATFATLFEQQPPAIADCRVLELGCAQGHNLIAMAYALPNSYFVGIDHSERQITTGKQLVSNLNLTNIQLVCADLQHLSPDVGKFDYIIAHGVYSWVAPAVQRKLLAIYRDHLQYNGIAYLSYNTYPGWQSDAMLREMLLFHLQHLDSPQARLEKAKQLLKFFADSIAHRYDNYALSLKNELHYLLQLPDNYFAHEHLEEHNHAVFFYQLIQQLEHYKLHYLTDLQTYADSPLFGEFMTNLTTQQQYQDFLNNRRYRETLLCHHSISSPSQFNLNKIRQLYIAAAFKITATAAQLDDNTEIIIEHLNGKVVAKPVLPLLKRVCYHLSKIYPKPIQFQQLMTIIDQDNRVACDEVDIEEVQHFLFALFLKKDVEFYSYPPHFCSSVTAHPVASALARWQSQRGAAVTNLRGETFWLEHTSLLALQLLDGTLSHRQILSLLNKQLAEDTLTFPQLQRLLENLAHQAFLVS